MSRKKHGQRKSSPAEGSPLAEIGRRGGWTAAGASRAARDARIATAAHLRTADVARDWEMSKLLNGTTVCRDHAQALAKSKGVRITDTQRDDLVDLMLLGGSGIPRPYPTDLDDAARAICERQAADLDAATLYVVSPSMCDVITAAAQTLTLDDLALLTTADLPSPTGLVMLPFPLIVRTASGGLSDDRAYCWHTPAHLETPGPLRNGPIARLTRRVLTATTPEDWQPAAPPKQWVRVTSYMDSHGPVRPDSFRDMAATAAAAGTPLPPLLADATRTHPFEPTITDTSRDALSSFTTATRHHGDRRREISAALGFDEGDAVDTTRGFTYHPGDEINDEDELFVVRFLYAFWRLAGQHIAEITDPPPNHSARVQAERAGISPDVRVVTMKPTRRTTSTDEPAARDWQHRWVVRMHKVRQWYPSEQRHKIIYRGPYVKGPADKPLLGGDVVRSMT